MYMYMYVHSDNVIKYIELDRLCHNTGISANTPAGLVTSKARLLMYSVNLPARAQVEAVKRKARVCLL